VAVLYTPTPDDHFGGAPPLAFSPQDPHVLYMGAQYVLASNDGARTWRHLSPDLTGARGDTTPLLPGVRRLQATIETLAPSTVARGEIWAGTSNGLIQLTRDGGATWTEVKPDLPPRAGVSVIDASHHSAGVAYATASVFGDDHPYIYRTTDFGKSWAKIVTGLPGEGVVRTVREDPVDADLIYAGTVKGVWVSFDRGDHWQSLQLNLPTTVVSDLTVHDNDLAISTYGRGLWILDDVTPLRQARGAVASASTPYLYRPERAIRIRWDNIQDTPLPPEVPAGENPPEGAIIDYRLAAPAHSVTLSMYDSANHLVRSYSSAAPPADTSPPNIPTYWFAPLVVLPTTPGMHRIAWDLREPPPEALNYGYYGTLLDYTEYTLNTHSVLGATPRREPTGPLVAPGRYRVELDVDGKSLTQPLEVMNDPRVPISTQALVTQTRFQERIVAGMAVSYDQFNRVTALRGALASAAARDTQLVATARALDALASGTGGQSGFGPANRDLARHLDDMEFGDALPTPSDIAAVEADCREIDRALAGFRRMATQDLSSLNARLKAAHRAEVAVEPVPAGPACGRP